MNPINSVGSSSPINRVQTSPGVRPESTVTAGQPDRQDTVELSGLQNYLQVLKTNDIRADKVAEIRAQIDAGTYETDEKLEIAADRLLDDLA